MMLQGKRMNSKPLVNALLMMLSKESMAGMLRCIVSFMSHSSECFGVGVVNIYRCLVSLAAS